MKKRKLLIVDDDSTVRTLLRDLLEPRDFDVEEATDGQEGFRKAISGDYHAVLMDLKMPNWNGLDSIKSMEMVNQNVRIIVVTGYMDSDMAQEIDENPNVIGCFEKPFSTQKLVDFIEHLVPSRNEGRGKSGEREEGNG